jgi:hypothetical protein
MHIIHPSAGTNALPDRWFWKKKKTTSELQFNHPNDRLPTSTSIPHCRANAAISCFRRARLFSGKKHSRHIAKNHRKKNAQQRRPSRHPTAARFGQSRYYRRQQYHEGRTGWTYRRCLSSIQSKGRGRVYYICDGGLPDRSRYVARSLTDLPAVYL